MEMRVTGVYETLAGDVGMIIDHGATSPASVGLGASLNLAALDQDADCDAAWMR
ncbi:hypothetical protein E4U55_001061, partial [Claviceps digitariae]